MILAIDPSMTGFGAVLVPEHGEHRWLVVGTEPQAKRRHWWTVDDDQRRLRLIFDALDNILMELVGQVDLPAAVLDGVACESPCFCRSIKAAKSLEKLNGAIVAWARNWCDHPVRFVPPEDVKLALAGRANAEKAQMVAAAEAKGLRLPPVHIDSKTGKPTKGQDAREAIADAYGVLLASGLWHKS